VGYRSALLEELGVPHVFTTRHGGGPGALDAGALDEDAARRVARAAGAPAARMDSLRQIPGAEVREVGAEADLGELGEADALVGARPDRLLLIRVADCVPVLFASPDGRRVAAAHAGWRGLVAGVLERTVERLGAVGAAAIGPCLSLARFEVGPEVAAAFAERGLEAAVHPRGTARPHVDLRAAAALALRRAGVLRIESTDRCTFEHAEEFFSYRRDVGAGARRATGRLGAAIAPSIAP
jgi:YfiH family protein